MSRSQSMIDTQPHVRAHTHAKRYIICDVTDQKLKFVGGSKFYLYSPIFETSRSDWCFHACVIDFAHIISLQMSKCTHKNGFCTHNKVTYVLSKWWHICPKEQCWSETHSSPSWQQCVCVFVFMFIRSLASVCIHHFSFSIRNWISIRSTFQFTCFSPIFCFLIFILCVYAFYLFHVVRLFILYDFVIHNISWQLPCGKRNIYRTWKPHTCFGSKLCDYYFSL